MRGIKAVAERELVFNLILIVIYSLFSIIRIEYYRRARRAGLRTIVKEDVRYSILLSLLIVYEVATFFIYLLFPQLMAWGSITLPYFLRWFGAALGGIALILFVWVHRNLGSNFSNRLLIKEQHMLVTQGPYQWIRHPMYTAFYILHIAAFFLTASWFIGITWITGLTLIVIIRVRREESMMIQRFGDDYRTYMKRTGRFFPLPATIRRTPTMRS